MSTRVCYLLGTDLRIVTRNAPPQTAIILIHSHTQPNYTVKDTLKLFHKYKRAQVSPGVTRRSLFPHNVLGRAMN